MTDRHHLHLSCVTSTHKHTFPVEQTSTFGRNDCKIVGVFDVIFLNCDIWHVGLLLLLLRGPDQSNTEPCYALVLSVRLSFCTFFCPVRVSKSRKKSRKKDFKFEAFKLHPPSSGRKLKSQSNAGRLNLRIDAELFHTWRHVTCASAVGCCAEGG